YTLSLHDALPICDNTFFPRARTPDGGADILPARPPRQESRKSMTRAAQSLSAKCLAARIAKSQLVSCSAWRLTALDGSSPAIGSHRHKYFRRHAARFGPAAAP